MLVLHGFRPAFGLPSPGPFAIKSEIHLMMAGLPYRLEASAIAAAPRGKLPYLEDGEHRIADSTFIRRHIEARCGCDLDAALSPDQHAAAWALERLAEDSLYWLMVHARWAIDANFLDGPAHFYDTLPAGEADAVRLGQRTRVLGYLQGQGTGRLTAGEIGYVATRGYDAIAVALGDKPFLFGDAPCGTDASIFAQVASALVPTFPSPVRDAAARHPALAAYADRMLARFYPGFVRNGPA